MFWRLVWGGVMAAGVVLLLWDLLTIGRGETRAIQPLESHDEGPAGARGPAAAAG